MKTSHTLHRYWLKARKFMLYLQSKDFLVFVFCLLVSSSFWLMQTLNEVLDVQVTVPLRLKNVPSDVVVTTPLPSEVRLAVHDRGTSLWNLFRRSQLDTLDIDFNLYDANQPSGRGVVSGQDVQKRVLEQLESSASILRMSPDTLDFFYTRNRPRRFPVRFVGTITTTAQTYLRDVRCTPDSVTVWAPRSVLDTMTAVYMMPMTHQGVAETETHTARLKQRSGVKLEPASVSYQLLIDSYSEKTVEVPITSGNFPADMDLRTFPSRVKVTFRVGTAIYNQITAESFVLRITYEDLLKNEGNKYRLRFQNVPDGVSNVRITPAEVDYLIEQVDRDEDDGGDD